MRRRPATTALCLVDLNLDVISHILSYLEQPSLLCLASASKAWYNLVFPDLFKAASIRNISSAERLLVLLDSHRPLFRKMRSLDISIPRHWWNSPRETQTPLLRAATSVLCAAPLLTRLVLNIGPFVLRPEDDIHHDMERAILALDRLQELHMDEMVPWLAAILVRVPMPLALVNVSIKDLGTPNPIVQASATLKTVTLRSCTLPRTPPVFHHVERLTLSRCEIPGTDLFTMFPKAQHVELQGLSRPYNDPAWYEPFVAVEGQLKTWRIDLVTDYNGLRLVAGYSTVRKLCMVTGWNNASLLALLREVSPSVVCTVVGGYLRSVVDSCPNLERLSLSLAAGSADTHNFYTDTLLKFFEGFEGDFVTMRFTYEQWARIAVNLSSADAPRSYATRLAKRFVALGHVGLFLQGVEGTWPAVWTVKHMGGKKRKLTRLTGEEAQRVRKERVERLQSVPVEHDGQIHIYFDQD